VDGGQAVVNGQPQQGAGTAVAPERIAEAGRQAGGGDAQHLAAGRRRRLVRGALAAGGDQGGAETGGDEAAKAVRRHEGDCSCMRAFAPMMSITPASASSVIGPPASRAALRRGSARAAAGLRAAASNNCV